MTKIINIRAATSSDAKAITLLAHELAESENRQSFCSELSILNDAFSDNPKCFFAVAEIIYNTTGEAVEEIVGFVMYYYGYDLESSSSGMHLGDIIVTKKHQRKNIGKKLMQHIAKIAQEKQQEWISWTVQNNNKNAQRFYKKLGASNIPICFMAMGKTDIGNLTSKN